MKPITKKIIVGGAVVGAGLLLWQRRAKAAAPQPAKALVDLLGNARDGVSDWLGHFTSFVRHEDRINNEPAGSVKITSCDGGDGSTLVCGEIPE